MKHFVVYHNPETMGYDARTIEGFGILTTKSVAEAVGSRIWVITGRGAPRAYSLVQTFIAERAGPHPEDPTLNCAEASTGTAYRPEIQLNKLGWFPAFFSLMGHFGLGYQRLNEVRFINALEELDRRFVNSRSPLKRRRPAQ